MGFQPFASGSFLKSEVVMYGPRKYCGSSTLLVTVNQRSPFGIVLTSKYSVTTALSLYGAPFFRTYPDRSCVVVTLRSPPGSVTVALRPVRLVRAAEMGLPGRSAR